MNRKGSLLVISGPSGCGKTSVATALSEHHGFERIVTATTRPARPGEVNGMHYHFLSREEFKRRQAERKFAEWAEVHGYLYGTLASTLRECVDRGKKGILAIDVQGHELLRLHTDRELVYWLMSVFLTVPLELVERRLRNRPDMASAPPDYIELRLKNAKEEIARASEFDLQVANPEGGLHDAVREIALAVEGFMRKRRAPYDLPASHMVVHTRARSRV